MDDFFRSQLSAAPVVAILRGFTPERTAAVARACWDAGVRLVEVPLQDASSLEAFAAAAEGADDVTRLLGAGTARTPEDVDQAARLGARFLVSPSVHEDTVRAARTAGLPILPGVLTPTEVETARRLGCGVQKLFPAGLLGPSAVSALRAPFPDVDLVAVGAVGPDDVERYLAAGARGVALGSALAEPGALDALAELLRRTRKEQP